MTDNVIKFEVLEKDEHEDSEVEASTSSGELKKPQSKMAIYIMLSILISIILFLLIRPHHGERKRTYFNTPEEEENIKRFAFTASSAINFDLILQLPDRPLIIYSYHEREHARVNIGFFIMNGLHAAADFLFILNGETNVDELLPKNAPNIRVIKRDNTCYDLGSIGEVLRMNDKELVKKYPRFIFINSSIKGPFLPVWSDDCWTDLYLNKLTNQTKLVGMSYNCYPTRHVQSMIAATDREGVEILLAGIPDEEEIWDHNINNNSLSGLSSCITNGNKAISAEISLTNLIRKASYNFTVMMTAASSDPDYYQTCNHSDILAQNSYFGISLHPYETLFIQATIEHYDAKTIDIITEWQQGRGYNSWEKCKVLV
jgi:hypothetical protein